MQIPINQSAVSPPALNNKAEDGKAAAKQEDVLRQKAVEFEAVFIGQMLKFSGLDKALTMGGGEEVSAFTGFYIDQYADKIAQKGGFGLADKIYEQMSRLDKTQKGDASVKLDKL